MDVALACDPVVDTGVRNSTNVNVFEFRKKFNFNVKSTKYEYSKSDKTDGTEMICKTYIHGLPMHKLFMYMTEKEFNDTTSIYHTTKIKKIYYKITNLGNRTPFITSAKTVSYANANSQTTIGIWENLEDIGPVNLPSNVTPLMLYGKQLKDFATTNNKTIDEKDYGATSQSKKLDTRVQYRYYTKTKANDDVKLTNDGNFHLPPLIMMATKFYNATNSIGMIYEKTYEPIDGTINVLNNAWYRPGFVARHDAPPFDIYQKNGYLTEAFIQRSHDLAKQKYPEHTIDNFRFNGMSTNSPTGFINTVGIGILPLLNNDGNLEDSVFNFLIETSIVLEGHSHGTNLLMGPSNHPQPNSSAVKLTAAKRKFFDAFGVNGLPVIGEEPTERAEPDEVEYTPDNEWSHIADGADLEIHGVTVSGQKRITGKMTQLERQEVVRKNLERRQQYQQEQEAHGTTITWKEGKNVQYGIPNDPMVIPPQTDGFWKEVYNVGKNQ